MIGFYKWKMRFNCNHTKPVLEVVFSGITSETRHLLLIINKAVIKRVPFHKHLGQIWGSKLDFKEQLDNVLSRADKMIALLQYIMPRRSVLTIYKTVVRLHFDYGDAVYDKVLNESFHKKN